MLFALGYLVYLSAIEMGDAFIVPDTADVVDVLFDVDIDGSDVDDNHAPDLVEVGC